MIFSFYSILKQLAPFLFIILVRPKFTHNKMKSFVVVKAGNSVRITVNFEVRFILYHLKLTLLQNETCQESKGICMHLKYSRDD